MRTFAITTLGCRVNHYESEQLAALLRQRGLVQAPVEDADLRIVHTCSVTIQAASKSRQAVRRMARRTTRLPVLASTPVSDDRKTCAGVTDPDAAIRNSAQVSLSDESSIFTSVPIDPPHASGRRRVIVTGCWATSDPKEAAALRGVDAVVGHHQDVNQELSRLLTQWEAQEQDAPSFPGRLEPKLGSASSEPVFDDGWMKQKAGIPAGLITTHNEPHGAKEVNGKLEDDEDSCEEEHEEPEYEEARSQKPVARRMRGMVTLPLLGERQSAQRAFLKVQDGCDAHCTYCIIPQLRPGLWSKTVEDAVEEARRLVEAGHGEIVLTGIFLGAYGHGTALRRRQAGGQPLALLIDALCTRVPGLRRLRLSSLEPGDLTPALIETLASHRQVVPHFHLPLQSGSDALLHRMNRQYTRDEYLRMVEQVRRVFDRPALTTDIIVGFPGETQADFERTIEVVERVGFIHIHAFSYSPRPRTAAARWTRDFLRGPVVNERIDRLRDLAAVNSLDFRRTFVGETVEVLVERPSGEEQEMEALAGFVHGRCERYFPVHFEARGLDAGSAARVRVDRVTATHTFGTVLEGVV